MRGRLDELKNKRDELIARSKTAEAQGKVQDAISSINVMDPTTEISRFEDQVRREEARVQGQTEIAATSLEAQFDELRDYGAEAEVEARLAALKGGGDTAQIEGVQDADVVTEDQPEEQQQY